ncbi:hypothetical protein [Haloarcula pelagica]
MWITPKPEDAPKSRPSRRRYLRHLGRYDLIETEGIGSATVYRSLP